MPWVSSEAMSVHLAEIGKTAAARAHCVLPATVQDGTKPATASRSLKTSLCSACGPISPELNPIENVWEYLRANYLIPIRAAIDSDVMRRGAATADSVTV